MDNEEEPTHRVEWQVMSTGKMGWTGPMTLRQAEGYATGGTRPTLKLITGPHPCR